MQTVERYKYKIRVNKWGNRFTTVNGYLHNEVGPAIRYFSVPGYKEEWYLNDCWYSEEQFSEEKDKGLRRFT